MIKKVERFLSLIEKQNLKLILLLPLETISISMCHVLTALLFRHIPEVDLGLLQRPRWSAL